jgi:hypothetical protein
MNETVWNFKLDYLLLQCMHILMYNIQWVPEVSEHPREPYGKRSFSLRFHKLSFRRNATNFRLELAMSSSFTWIFLEFFNHGKVGFWSEPKLSEHAREPYGNKLRLMVNYDVLWRLMASYNSETAKARITGKVLINRASLALYAL